MKNQLSIGQLARRVGVTASLVRYYEDIKLLPAATRADNGYRVYGQVDVERLQFIERAKSLEFTLEEIREILGLRAQGLAPCTYVIHQIDAKLIDVERKITALAQLKSELGQLQLQAASLPTNDIDPNSCVCHLIEI